MENRQELSSKSSDLWYTLHEDYVSFETFKDDFVAYLTIRVALLKSLSDTERLDARSQIKHNDTSGRNIAYSLLVTLAVTRDQFPDQLLKTLDTLLVATVDSFSVPNNPSFWDTLYSSIDTFITELKGTYDRV